MYSGKLEISRHETGKLLEFGSCCLCKQYDERNHQWIEISYRTDGTLIAANVSRIHHRRQLNIDVLQMGLEFILKKLPVDVALICSVVSGLSP
jgi:hypothetical protein